jgi:hypothetical protein
LSAGWLAEGDGLRQNSGVSEKKDRGRKVLDVGSNLAAAAGTLVDMGATGGIIAGGKLLWDAVMTGVGPRRRKQAEDYLKRLADALGSENTAALAVDLDEAGENQVWETIEEGFRAMMAAVNETAKRCIAVLVADYVVRQKLPDREFQMFGGLLAASDEALLHNLFVIARELSAVHSKNILDDGPPVTISTYALLLERDPERVPPPVAKLPDGVPLFAVGNHLTGRETRVKLDSDGVPCPANIDPAINLLARYEFGEVPTHQIRLSARGNKTEKHPHGAAPLLYIQDAQADRYLTLHSYLSPVFLEPSRD